MTLPLRIRRFRFSLRTLLATLTVAALVLGYWIYRSEQKAKSNAVVALMRLNARLRINDKAQVYSVSLTNAGHRSDIDTQLLHVNGVSAVSALWLGKTQVSDAGLANLKSLKNLERLDLDCTKVTDEGLKHLGEAKNLWDLSLVGTKVTSVGLMHLPTVKRLDLRRSATTDEGVEVLAANLTNLESLRLGNTKITDACLPALARLNKLRYLELEGTQVSDGAVSELQKFVPALSVDR